MKCFGVSVTKIIFAFITISSSFALAEESAKLDRVAIQLRYDESSKQKSLSIAELTALAAWVDSSVTLGDCPEPTTVQYFYTIVASGLADLKEINPSLVESIITKRLDRPLHIRCVREQRVTARYYPQSPLHKREIVAGQGLLKDTLSPLGSYAAHQFIFHEFLHYVGLKSISAHGKMKRLLSRDSQDRLLLETDEVYACALARAPSQSVEIEEAIKADPERFHKSVVSVCAGVTIK